MDHVYYPRSPLECSAAYGWHLCPSTGSVLSCKKLFLDHRPTGMTHSQWLTAAEKTAPSPVLAWGYSEGFPPPKFQVPIVHGFVLILTHVTKSPEGISGSTLPMLIWISVCTCAPWQLISCYHRLLASSCARHGTLEFYPSKNSSCEDSRGLLYFCHFYHLIQFFWCKKKNFK